MEQVKKKPVAKKPVDLSGELDEPKFFDVPQALKEELEGRGFVCRWLNKKKYIDNHGYHRTGWKAYKTTPGRAAGSLDFESGVDAEGFVCRGDMILGVKTKEMQERRRQQIEKKNTALNRFTKTAADELKATLGSKGSVIEGYDENGGDE